MNETTALLPLVPAWILVSIGFVLIAIELMAFNLFIFLWFGIAAIIIGALSFVIDFGHGEYQWLSIIIIGTAMLFTLRKRFMPTNAAPIELETFKTGEMGRVEKQDDRWVIQYQGTWWQIANPTDDLAEGQTKEVKEIRSNKAYLADEK